MNKCSPVEMRKNLQSVDLLKRYCLDFVVIPVIDGKNKDELTKLADKNFDIIIKNAENNR